LSAKVNLGVEVEGLQKSIADSSVRMIPGVGSIAFFLDIAGAGTQLHVIRDDRDYVMVSILGFGDAAAVSAAAEQIVRVALARI
jgi:hypothetical protein